MAGKPGHIVLGKNGAAPGGSRMRGCGKCILRLLIPDLRWFPDEVAYGHYPRNATSGKTMDSLKVMMTDLMATVIHLYRFFDPAAATVVNGNTDTNEPGTASSYDPARIVGPQKGRGHRPNHQYASEGSQ